jgi:hypothetical protein
MQTDGRTESQKDMTKVTVAFRNFVNASKMTDFQGASWPKSALDALYPNRNYIEDNNTLT